MDNCDLERLSFSGWKLHPAFKADVTNYRVTVASHVNKVTLDLRTSDCGASYRILFGDGNKTLRLSDGVNDVGIEVVAEDGTTKRYRVAITKLSATAAELSDLTIDGNVPLHPEFDTHIYEYNSTVPFYCNSVTMLPKLPDKDMKVFVNEDDITKPVLLNVGDTVVVIRVSSADDSNLQVYTVFVTREPIPMAVTFSDGRDQVAFECPVSLTALYRPISIHPSYPKHVFSGPYIEMLVRRSKVDPLNEYPLGDGWKVLEPELDKKMSAGVVKCFFAYRGCDHVMKLSELGSHALECPRRPRGELDIKDVADTDWYKQHFVTSASTLVIETRHTLEVRNWERRLQKAVRQGIVDDLCALAQDQLKLYRQRLPKPGDLLQYEDGENPLDILEQAGVYLASAIKLKSREARIHFLLGLVLEEHHYAMGMYGLKKAEVEDELQSEAKVTANQEEILAVCRLHGFRGTPPTMENQLQALDKEYRQLKDIGQSGKAEYIQTLYLCLSKKAGKDGSTAVKDPENCVQHALMKYLDAWTLSPDNWEYNLHVGRLLLLQGQSKEALQHLQTGLALRPGYPGLRFYTGLALLQQEDRASEATEKQAVLFLQQGLEHLLGKLCRPSDTEWDPADPISSVNTQFLRGLLSLGELQQRKVLTKKAMSAEQVYHTVAVLTAQAVSQCVCRGEVTRQLEWVLLEAHFALLQRMIHRMSSQDNAGTDRQAYVAKRSQALMALTRFTSIAPCQELLDMQEKVCQMAVVTVPRDAHALCVLGLAQLAQCDNDPDSIRSKIALANACLSFRASIELEGQSQSGDPPAQLHEQKWWQERVDVEKRRAANAKQTPSHLAGGKGPSDTAAAGRGSGRGKGGPGRWVAAAARAPSSSTTSSASSTSSMRGGKAAPPPAKPPAARGRGGASVKVNGAAKPPSKPGSKTTLSRSKSRPDCDPSSAERTDVSEPATGIRDHSLPSAVNRRSHMARLGLARALSRSARTVDKAKKLYHEVIIMAPRVHDPYIELAQLLEPTDALAAVGVYCKFPLKPPADQTVDDAFITGEIVRLLMKLEMFDHHQLGPCLIAYAKVMGVVTIEKYIDILDAKFMTRLLKTVYAGLHDKSEDDKDLQDFFKFKGWI